MVQLDLGLYWQWSKSQLSLEKIEKFLRGYGNSYLSFRDIKIDIHRLKASLEVESTTNGKLNASLENIELSKRS
jgi:uncharacterized protein (DUF488 family)